MSVTGKQITVVGAALCKVGPSGAITSALLDLGYTRNGAEIEFHEHAGNVPTDENGGDEGPPSDRQIFGITATIRLDLTRYDPSVVDLISGGRVIGSDWTSATPNNGTIAGTNIPQYAFPLSFVGALKIQGSLTYRLLIQGTTASATNGASPLYTNVSGVVTYNFPQVEWAEPVPVNAGTKFSSILLVGTAYGYRTSNGVARTLMNNLASAGSS